MATLKTATATNVFEEFKIEIQGENEAEFQS